MYRFPLKQIFDDCRFRKQIFDDSRFRKQIFEDSRFRKQIFEEGRFRKQIFEDSRFGKQIDSQQGGWSDLMQHRSTLATTPNSCSPCLKPLSTASTTSSEVNEPEIWTDTRFFSPVCVCFVCCGAAENEWIGLDINKLNLSLQLGSLGKICFQHREVRCRQRLHKIQLQPKNKIWFNPDVTCVYWYQMFFNSPFQLQPCLLWELAQCTENIILRKFARS